MVHNDIQEVCGSSRLVTAPVLRFTGSIALLTSNLVLIKHTSMVDKSAFAAIFSEAIYTHMILSYPLTLRPPKGSKHNM